MRGSNRIDITGRRFGRLIVIGPSKTYTPAGQLCWSCRCDCGAVLTVMGQRLRVGKTRSCGCLQREEAAARQYKHGEAFKTAEYRIWAGMKRRCELPTVKAFPRYGGRGIAVCEEWRHDYLRFLADMGRRPSPRHSIDRIDNDRGYSPDNCRWATKVEQAQNRRPRTHSRNPVSTPSQPARAKRACR